MTHNLHYRPHFLLFQFALPFMSILWGMLTLYSYMCMIAHLHTIILIHLIDKGWHRGLGGQANVDTEAKWTGKGWYRGWVDRQRLTQGLGGQTKVDTVAGWTGKGWNSGWVNRQRLTQWLGGETKVDTVAAWTDKGWHSGWMDRQRLRQRLGGETKVDAGAEWTVSILKLKVYKL